MKNKFVYFTQTDAPLTGIQRSYLNILCYTADKLRCTAYYINNRFSDETEYYKNSKAKFLSIEDGNTADFKDAVILVQPNYLFFMLSVLSIPDNTKICLLCGDPYSEKRLLDILSTTSSDCDSVLQMISEHNCRVFSDVSTDVHQKINITLTDGKSVPVLSDMLTASASATTLTVGMIKECAGIKHHLEAFKVYLKNDPRCSYSDFFTLLKNRRSDEAPKTVSISNRGKQIIKSVIKKVVPNSIIYRKYYRVQQEYKKKQEYVKKLLKKNGKIKVGFILVFNSVFPCRTVFECMLKSDIFDPYIIVAPNISRSMKFQTDTMNEAFESLSRQYPGRIISGYDIRNDSYLELGEEYSVIFFCNPYKNLVHPFHEIEYFLNKNVLTAYVSYGLATLSFWKNVLATDFYNYLWKATVETKDNYKFQKKHHKIRAKNTIIAGYPKMDKLANYTRDEKTKKTIIICPHHTVWGWRELNISNFLDYYDFFLRLPKIYPDINFIFRPHPLLFSHLKSHGIWSEEQIQEYLNKLKKNKNVVYDTSGDYLEQFAYSDAMIHDCGSFIGEYLYTGKPCCYMMKSKEYIKDNLTPLGKKCMAHHYHAFNEQEIRRFIEDVVINENDPMAKGRITFVNDELKIKYPYSAQYITENIKKSIIQTEDKK